MCGSYPLVLEWRLGAVPGTVLRQGSFSVDTEDHVLPEAEQPETTISEMHSSLSSAPEFLFWGSLLLIFMQR